MIRYKDTYFYEYKKMGGFFSTASVAKNQVGPMAPVSKVVTEKILIRHRPTCYSSDLEQGLTELENATVVVTTTQ